MNLNSPEMKVAIIGGGPSGICAAKALMEYSICPVIFEQSSRIGGQWNQGADHSGVWKNMRTNTSRYTTVFSDFPHNETIELFPVNQEILEYLESYASYFQIDKTVRLNTRVIQVSLKGDQYSIEYITQGKERQTEIFSHIIVASGRYNHPKYPVNKEIARFRGTILHSFNYPDAEAFKKKKVLVLGNRISGLEIACDLAEGGAEQVISACRTPRYIYKRIIAGLPAECILFTRYEHHILKTLSLEKSAERFKNFIVHHFGNPVDYGGLKPSEDLLQSGASMCEDYLEWIQKGVIVAKGDIKEFSENGVVFVNGEESTIDAVIFATGFNLNLSFLSEEIRSLIALGVTDPELYKFTFPPNLPNLAFTGMFSQTGPYFPVIELQARWVAACFIGKILLPNEQEMISNIENLSSRYRKQYIKYHEMISLFSREAGVVPEFVKYPDLLDSFLFGPLVPEQFRMDGNGKKSDAKARYMEISSVMGHFRDETITTEREKMYEILSRT
jgi:dimethylaniline monooxygenase (N-oxide forming)